MDARSAPQEVEEESGFEVVERGGLMSRVMMRCDAMRCCWQQKTDLNRMYELKFDMTGVS